MSKPEPPSLELTDFRARTCPMCLGAETDMFHCTKEHPPGAPHLDTSRFGGHATDHLHISCRRCRFMWLSETFEQMLQRLCRATQFPDNPTG